MLTQYWFADKVLKLQAENRPKNNQNQKFALRKNTIKTPQCIYFEKKLKSSH